MFLYKKSNISVRMKKANSSTKTRNFRKKNLSEIAEIIRKEV